MKIKILVIVLVAIVAITGVIMWISNPKSLRFQENNIIVSPKDATYIIEGGQ
jgi:cytochrome b subunit of formate dehydrogenase